MYVAPYVELYGTSYIQSSTGYHASIEYTTKGWISGELHHFKASVTHDTELKNPTIIEGQWTGKSTLTKHKQSSEPFLDLTALDKLEAKVAPVEDQHALESRKVWHKVAEALRAGDYMAASSEKAAIENEQRALRKKRAEDNEEWKPAHFKAASGQEIYGNLRDRILEKSDASKFVDTMGAESGWLYKEHDSLVSL